LEILKKNPEDRISISEMKTHPFFRTINWPKLLQKSVDPPKLRVPDVETKDWNSGIITKPVTLQKYMKQIILLETPEVEIRASVSLIPPNY
jgi:hypothetical protein